VIEAAGRLAASCHSQLQGWRPPNGDQERLRRSYLEFLAGAEDGWARSCPGAHLTGSALICAPDASQVLLTLHARLGRWLQTGGHLEAADPSLPEAALREAREESGLTQLRLCDEIALLSRHQVPCGPVRPTYHLDVQYLVIGDPDEAPAISAESSDLRWFAVDRLPEVDDSVRELIAAATERLG
jgi:8-oxo-dGTP pyrophosphatase MutT (NUDIX family)